MNYISCSCKRLRAFILAHNSQSTEADAHHCLDSVHIIEDDHPGVMLRPDAYWRAIASAHFASSYPRILADIRVNQDQSSFERMDR